ncbi:MAG: flagellar protein G [Candidatus Methanoperedens sp.]
MSGEGITHMIFFIGAIVIAVGVIGVVTTNVQSITASYAINSKTLADQLKTDITIINDPAKIPYVGTNYSFFVKNTGKNTLDNSSVNMFVDGNYTNVTNKMTIMEGGSIWYPTYVLRLNYTTATQFSSGDHTVRVVAGNGVFDTMPFRN